MISLHREFRLGVSTISIIVHTVCKSISDVLGSQCLSTPDVQRWLDISEKFQQHYNFPHCIGAIGAKKIRISNSKHLEYLVLFAICDSEYRFTYIEASCKDLDSWKDSTFHKLLSKNSLNIPSARQLSESDVVLPFVFVGDNSFSVAPHLMRPYAGRGLPVNRQVFNYRLARARRQIDCAFGILSNRWKIFQRRFDVTPAFAEAIVKSCCVLHNFLLDREGYEFEHTLVIEGLCKMHPYSCQGGRVANKVREDFASYFVSDAGQVPWQMSRILQT